VDFPHLPRYLRIGRFDFSCFRFLHNVHRRKGHWGDRGRRIDEWCFDDNSFCGPNYTTAEYIFLPRSLIDNSSELTEPCTVLVGIIMSVSVVGQAIGPLIGGAFTQYASWRWCKSMFRHKLKLSLIFHVGFYINIPAGAITGAVLCFIEVPDERKKYKTHKTLTELFFGLDLIGFSLFAPACIMFLMALQWGGIKHAWDSAMILGLFVGSFVTIGVFAFWEQRQGKDAMIPTGMIKRRIVYSSVCALFHYLSFIELKSMHLF